MKTFTNCAEKKAKQFLNLLQGYTKGIRITAILILLLMGVSNAWAIGFNKGNVIFRAQGWNNPTYVYLCVGHSSYTQVWRMTRISNTDLYHVWVNVDNNDNNWWNGCTYFAVIGSNTTVTSGNWGNGSLSNKGTKGYTAAYTQAYDINSKDGVYFFNKNNNTVNNGSFSIEWKGSHNDIQKLTATQSAKLRNTTNSSYTIPTGSWPTTLTLTGTYLTGNTTSEQSGAISTKSGENQDYEAVVTGSITHSYTESDDYQFDGWIKGSGTSITSTNATYSYNITAATTVYACFTKKYAVNFGVHSSGGGTISAKSGSTTLQTGNKIVGGSKIVFTASPSNGYSILGWYSDANCTSKIAEAGTSETYTINSLEATTNVYVKFERTWTVTIANDGNGTTTPNAENYTVGAETGIDINANPIDSENYEFLEWTSSVGGSFASPTTLAENKFYPTANTTLTATFRSTATYALTVGAGHGVVSASGSQDPIDLGSTYPISATLLDGYKFTKWTAEPAANATFASATSANTTVTITNGSVTVTANAEEIKHAVQVNIKTGQEAWGALSTNSVEVGQITKSTTITATPNTAVGYEFDHWEISDGITIVDGTENSTEITIKATKVGSITAHFRGINRPQNIFLIGTMNDWKESDADWQFYKLPGESGNTVTLTKTINKSDYHADGYKFGVNIYQAGWEDKWWHNSAENDTKMDAHNCTGWVFGTKEGDKKTFIDLNVSGEYTFTLAHSGTYNQQALSITYPDKSFIEGDFATAWDEDAYPLTENGNIQTVTIPITSQKDVEFRLVSHGKLFGTSTKITRKSNSLKLSAKNMEDEGAVIKIGADLEGDYKFTYDKSTNTLTVTYPTAYTVTYGVGTNKGTDEVTTNPSISSGSLVLASTSITFSKGDTKAGYTWKNWNSKADGNGSVLGTGDTYVSSSRAGDISVYACYDLITYNITYNLNGGSGASNTTYNVESATITLPTAPTKTGYTFAGWYDNANLTGNEVTQIAKGSTGDKTFYAKWTPINYTINYELGEGGTNHKDNPATYTIETATTELQDATPNAGYSFGGWYSDSEYANQVTQVAGGTTGNITLYAKWSAKAYTVNFDNNGGDGNTTPVTVAMGDPMPDVEIPTLHGYDFGGYWKDETQYYNADGTSAKNWDIDANDVILVAKWTAHPYTITYHLDGGTGASNTTYTIESEEITLPKPTKQYNAFAGWYDNSDFNGEAITSIASGSTGDKEFWAKWNIGTYAVSLDMQSGTGGTTSVNATYGAAMPAITIPTKEDHLFDGYYDQTGGKGTKYYNADGTSAKNWNKEGATLYAKWIPYTKCIFFKNNLKWANVYVYTFKDNVWYDYEDANTKYGPGVCTKTTNNLEFAKMTKIGNTDIYYYALTSETGFCHIAFSDVAMNNWNEFYGGNAVYRADRYDQLPLFVPQTDQTPSTTNSTKYYSTGIWMKYNSTYSGYDWSGKTGNEAWGNHNLTAQDAGGFSFTTTVNLNAGTTYEFKISNIGRDAKNDAIVGSAWYGRTGTTFTPSKHSDITFYTNNENAKITPTVDGQYTFTVYLGDGKVVVSLDYPLLPGDYRLVYKDNTANSAHASHYIKKVSEQASKTESFFVRKDQNAQLFIQKCTAINSGVPAWETIANTTIYINNLIESTGVYNFEFTQNGEAVAITQKAEPYTGSYYIRTDAAAGGWNTFRQDGNKMTYSSYAERNSGLFNHYFCKWVENKKDGEGNDIHTNVKFVIANDYSYCVSDTLDGDEVINDGQRIGFLPQSANVRFGWDSRTNQVSRAYISGSSAVSDRFLVLKGDENLTDLNGDNFNIAELNPHETTFEDMGNWVYQLDVKAGRGTNIQLTARYNGKDQSFFSTSGASLIDATTPQSYKVRFIYDFKTNHLVAAWLLDDYNTSGGVELNSNMLVIRKQHEQAQQLKLNADLTKVGTAYGVLTFDKYFLNNLSAEGNTKGQELLEAEKKNIYERALYWVSFPFDVRIRDVFGFGEYMDTWIMEYYDGAKRAEKGAWVDSESYWTYITDLDYVLESGTGYILCLDLEKMTPESPVFANTDEVSLYFPSEEPIGDINANQAVSITLPKHDCTIERDNRYIMDDNWNVIGVPRFVNLDIELSEYSSLGQSDVLYYYNYNASNGSYQVAASGSSTFEVMKAYMVQYAGKIDWWTESAAPQQMAARRNADAGPEKVSLRLEIAQDDITADKTFIQLQEEGATADFDMNIDLTKIINAGANIYTLVGEGNIQTAGNVLPMDECEVPVGVKVDAAGEYTIRMPEGSEGMVVELIDYYTNTRTNLLLFDYTVDLTAGTCEDRFALHIQPEKSGVATDIDQLTGSDLNAEGVQKYIIDGRLYLKKNGVLYDAQGHSRSAVGVR